MKYSLFAMAGLCAMAACAQTLSVPSVTGEAGKDVDVEIVFQNPANGDVTAAARPATIEWLVSYPAQDLIISGTGPSIAAAARAAGKFLSCQGTWKKAPSTYSYRCILTGGIDPVPDGTLATIRLKVRPNAKGGNRSVELDQIVAANSAAKKIKLNKANGAVVISSVGK
jgi:hypothetical protein